MKPTFTLCTAMLICTSQAAPESQGLIGVKLNILWRTEVLLGYDISSTFPQDSTPAVTVLYYLPAALEGVDGRSLSTISPLSPLHHDLRSSPEGQPCRACAPQENDAASILGYSWVNANAFPGISPIFRVSGRRLGGSDKSNTLIESGDTRHPLETLPGYGRDGVLGYAYARFTNSEELVPVSGGGMTVKSNVNAGGAVYEWWWKNKQFINDYDHGRQLSTELYTEDGKALEETGDQFGGPKVPVYARHPSPTLYVRNVSGNTQSTRAIPLEWSPQNFSGGKDNPVIYVNAKIGKELTLDWKGPDGVDRHWPVAQHESIYEGPPFALATVEAPTAYLNAEFTTYYKYEPDKDVLTSVSAHHTHINLSAGTAFGLILASGPGRNAVAMGVYINDPNAGIVLYDNSGPDGGKYGSSFSKWGIVYKSSVASRWQFRTWIITDTVANIQDDFRQLHSWKVTSREMNSPSS